MGVFIRTVLLGAVSGSVYALASTGLVLTYKTSGVLNFGYGAIALFTAFIHWQLTVAWGLPVALSALLVVLVVAPMIGVFLDTQLFRRIEGQPMVINVIATVGLTVLLQGLVFLIWGAEFRRVPSLFPRGTFGLPGGANIGTDQLAILFVAAGAAGALALVFRFTRIGVSFRAVVDNRSLAGLMAVNTGAVSALAWALGTAFAALTGILLAPQVLLDPIFFPALVVTQVLGAAIIGYLRSLPLAYAGGILIGVMQGLLLQYGGPLARLEPAAPFIVVTAAVLFAPRALRLAGQGASFVVRTRELSRRAGSSGTIAGAAVFGILALVPLLTLNAISWRLQLTYGMAFAVVFLSLVILTGYSGQISLGHTAFMGIAAFTAANLTTESGLPTWTALIVGPLAAAPAGALIGIVAVRLHGLFLALMTLAFAFMAQEMIFDDVRVSGGFGGIDLFRPEGASGDTVFYFVVLAALGLCALLAVSLRTGRTGRVLAAIRDSEAACRALGINVLKYKVVIFALSSAMAGLGAVLLSMTNENVGQQTFIPFLSLVYTTLAVVGGIFHVGGAIASGLLFGLYPQLFGHIELMSRLQYILFGLGATLALGQNPEGLFGELRRAGAAIAGWLERRRSRAAPLPVAGGQD